MQPAIHDTVKSLQSLRHFLANAPREFLPGERIRRHELPNAEFVSCVKWDNEFFISGTDILRCIVYRFHAIGREVVKRAKFEEFVFSDLRSLKSNVQARLEDGKSELLVFLHDHDCIRTKKKQRVFHWDAVPHDQLFLDTLERELRRAVMDYSHNDVGRISVVYREPALSLRFDPLQKVVNQMASIMHFTPPQYKELMAALFNIAYTAPSHPLMPESHQDPQPASQAIRPAVPPPPSPHPPMPQPIAVSLPGMYHVPYLMPTGDQYAQSMLVPMQYSQNSAPAPTFPAMHMLSQPQTHVLAHLQGPHSAPPSSRSLAPLQLERSPGTPPVMMPTVPLAQSLGRLSVPSGVATAFSPGVSSPPTPTVSSHVGSPKLQPVLLPSGTSQASPTNEASLPLFSCSPDRPEDRFILRVDSASNLARSHLLLPQYVRADSQQLLQSFKHVQQLKHSHAPIGALHDSNDLQRHVYTPSSQWSSSGVSESRRNSSFSSAVSSRGSGQSQQSISNSGRRGSFQNHQGVPSSGCRGSAHRIHSMPSIQSMQSMRSSNSDPVVRTSSAISSKTTFPTTEEQQSGESWQEETLPSISLPKEEETLPSIYDALSLRDPDAREME